MFTNIVCAVDGSEQAVLALEYASHMAQRDGAQLHLAHVREKLVAGRAAGQNVHLDEEQIDAKIQVQMDVLAAKYGIKPTLHMTAGTAANAAHQIAEIAGDVTADLIVIGTRGHSAVAGAVLGSVTQRLLHLAHCPVLAVPPPLPAAERTDRVGAMTTAS